MSDQTPLKGKARVEAMTETRFGTFDELLGGVDEEMALVARELWGCPRRAVRQQPKH